MSAKNNREVALTGHAPNTIGMTVKVFPAQENSKNLLATASVTLGDCFAIKGIHIVDSEKGAFVSMPQRKDAKGEYHDVCFPTTKEMREALNTAVLNEYQKTAERAYSRAGQTMEKRASALGKLREKAAEVKPRAPTAAKAADRGAR